MWTAKIKFSGKGKLVGSKTLKYNINLFGFPLSYYYEKDWITVQITGTIFGKKEDKKRFIRELKKEARVINFESNNDFFIGTIQEPVYTKCIYNKDIIHLAPALISEKGYEIITIGSFQRQPLTKIINLFEEKYNGKLISIQQKKVKSISIIKMHPELTGKQKEAMTLAIKEGYYHSPRKISVQQLAKLTNLSFSTYQVHLRKAEEKLMPYLFE
ncbi:MAG: helix-turn-helix domain-containing protein [Nanoarchaeota archaeon]|nr:helix-turn-helix domain-containing protein [Nanoarchaeota archaeon]